MDCVSSIWFATKNLHLATIFYHLVAKWRLNDFVISSPEFKIVILKGRESNCRVPQPRCLRIMQTPFQPSTTILTVALVFITSLFHGTRWKTKITVIKKCSHKNSEIYGKTKRNENLHCPNPGWAKAVLYLPVSERISDYTPNWAFSNSKNNSTWKYTELNLITWSWIND